MREEGCEVRELREQHMLQDLQAQRGLGLDSELGRDAGTVSTRAKLCSEHGEGAVEGTWGVWWE